MAITETIQEVKVVLDLTKGTQTIPNCKIDASAEALHTIGMAVGSLHAEEVEKVIKVTESILV